MSMLWKSSLSLRGRNLRTQTSCHNIQIKHCLRQLLRDPELRFSHTADRSVRDASATVAQLKPVKQDKSWLCQACTLQSTAEMTMAVDSAHAAGIYLKATTDHILSGLFRQPVKLDYKRCQSTSTKKKSSKKKQVQKTQISCHVQESLQIHSKLFFTDTEKNSPTCHCFSCSVKRSGML